MTNKFYITTPIYYVNDKPHIGHLCTTMAADVLARHYRQKLGPENVFFLTGTDEHGAKIAEAAENAGIDPKTYCDDYADQFQKNWQSLNLSYDFFIRTTDPRHEAIVSQLIQKLYDQGDIYKGKYEGLYCIGCEKFLTDTDLVDGKCPFHPNKEPVFQSEENYFFKLSRFQDQLKEAITDEKSPLYFKIVPENKKQEILNKLEKGLNDISISRAQVSWGINLPWDKSQTIYVWFDALLNYYTATKFIEGKERFWPADLHIVGKDISWFHSIIWEAMLLAAGEKLPKEILVHSFYMSGGQKMSKSIGNVIAPSDLLNSFGLEGTRYLILATFPYGSDSDITFDYLKSKYNSDLANGLGNLVQRVSKLCENNKVVLEEVVEEHPITAQVVEKIENYKFPHAMELLWQEVHKLDQEVDQAKPWTLSGEEAISVLKPIASKLSQLGKLLIPLLPQTAQTIAETFVGEVKAPKTPLFLRLK